MYIQFWGVRGSLPSTLNTIDWAKHFEKLMRDFFKEGHRSAEHIDAFIQKKTLPYIGGFGTATTCVELQDQESSLLIDMGSGIKNYSDHLEKTGQLKTISEYHILMSHFHFDHILGIPFFAPHFMKGKTIHYYSVQPETEAIVQQMFQKPTFPVPFEGLLAKIKFHRIEAHKKVIINTFEVTPYQLDHPDPCYGFRVEKNGKSYAHAVDHESIRITADQLGVDADLFKNVNLLYFDAQYTESEMQKKQGWGHGTCDRGFEVSASFNVQQILFAHHDPSADLEKIWNDKKNAEKILKEKFPVLASRSDFKWSYAYEGFSVKL